MREDSEKLLVEKIDISHKRLVELTNLADQAKPFYEWIESKFQILLDNNHSLDQNLKTITKENLKEIIKNCYFVEKPEHPPLLFDGIGRSYSHLKACYYFFSWIIRDAPQQRLAPLISRIVKQSNLNKTEAEIEALSLLICKYRNNVKTFSWESIREVIIDRLEGSRRSIKGHEKEAIVRTALLIALQKYYSENSNYGVYTTVEVANKQIMIEAESFDVSVNLLNDTGKTLHRILIPIKTRETEGGGHSHLFSRDVKSAISVAKTHSSKDYLVIVIIAKNWSLREIDELREKVDLIIALDINPSEFTQFDEENQTQFNNFVASILEKKVLPKV